MTTWDRVRWHASPWIKLTIGATWTVGALAGLVDGRMRWFYAAFGPLFLVGFAMDFVERARGNGGPP